MPPAVGGRGGGGGRGPALLGLPPRRSRETGRRERVAEVLESCGIADLRRSLAGSLPPGFEDWNADHVFFDAVLKALRETPGTDEASPGGRREHAGSLRGGGETVAEQASDAIPFE